MSERHDIPYYLNFLGPTLLSSLQQDALPVDGVDGLVSVGDTPPELRAYESPEGLQFVCDVYDAVKDELGQLLEQRIVDRQFIREMTYKLNADNEASGAAYTSKEYKTVIGMKNEEGRLVVGPYTEGEYYEKVHGGDWRVPEQPSYMAGFHLTLFGPADTEKMSINAMNAWHRKPDDEAEIITELVEASDIVPRWGADNEDSKTPTKLPFLRALKNLSGCFNRDLEFVEEDGREYKLQSEHLAHPIKRFPGLALPNGNLLYRGNPLPMHIYDFALHLYYHWHQKEALCFYVPKLENEEEARYIRNLLHTAESLIKARHPEYEMGTICLLIVLENPRAIFRAEEMMYEMHPYFAGASLGWHDYLASAASLFEQDPNYRIPVKADPDIVINHIKESHDFLNRVVGARGGIKIGGMYGTLPERGNPRSLEVSMIGYIRDVITQLKRGLDGFWIAHPDFLRPGIALVEGWRRMEEDKGVSLRAVVDALVPSDEDCDAVWSFILGQDVSGLDHTDPLYPRALLAADLEESDVIANNDPEEVRYNVFQALQYITDWLTGNGCVALPAQLKGVFVRIMDDLATTERSRREVWAEIHHKRFSLTELRTIFLEELAFIQRDSATEAKKVVVKWNEETSRWYNIAEKVLFLLMSEETPVEFATEYLLPFTLEPVRSSQDPWRTMHEFDPEKYPLKIFPEEFLP
jgi:malate synthase